MINQKPRIIAIITGTTRGIGSALQFHLLKENIEVISINRNSLEKLEAGHLLNIPFDLSDIPAIPELVQKISMFLKDRIYDKLWLINNAARLGAIKKMTEEDTESLAETLETNLISPLNISSMLLHALPEHIAKRVINISSGAAFQPIYGLGAYCISKAGLEMMSKMIAIENEQSNIKSITIGPGVVDTSMQEQIRNSSVEDFKRLEQFISFKKDGILLSTEVIAQKITTFLINDSYESGSHFTIEELK